MTAEAWRIEQPDLRDMMFPVKCRHCRAVYDLRRVQVTGRYIDCTVWTAPCCGHPGIDDRPEAADRHYLTLDRGEVQWMADGYPDVSSYDAFGLRQRQRR